MRSEANFYRRSPRRNICQWHRNTNNSHKRNNVISSPVAPNTGTSTTSGTSITSPTSTSSTSGIASGFSVMDEHRRIFGFRPSVGGSQRQRNAGRGRAVSIPARPRQTTFSPKNTWTKTFLYLAKKHQTTVPSAAEKIALTYGELGEQKIIAIDSTRLKPVTRLDSSEAVDSTRVKPLTRPDSTRSETEMTRLVTRPLSDSTGDSTCRGPVTTLVVCFVVFWWRVLGRQ